jgi:hypothetical protein
VRQWPIQCVTEPTAAYGFLSWGGTYLNFPSFQPFLIHRVRILACRSTFDAYAIQKYRYFKEDSVSYTAKSSGKTVIKKYTSIW